MEDNEIHAVREGGHKKIRKTSLGFVARWRHLPRTLRAKLTAGTSKCLGVVHAEAEATRAATMASFILDSRIDGTSESSFYVHEHLHGLFTVRK